MVINWTNIAVQDLKEFKQITKMIKPEEYIIRLVTYVDSLIKFPRLGRIYVYCSGFIVRVQYHYCTKNINKEWKKKRKKKLNLVNKQE